MLRKLLVAFAILLSLVLAVLAIPIDDASKIAIPEGAAATTLKFRILSAEFQCQMGGYINGDPLKVGTEHGDGEYGFFSELSGLRPVGGTTLNFLAPTFRNSSPIIDGYQFIVYLPDSDHSAATDPYTNPRTFNPRGAKLRKEHLIAYAWPVTPNDGRRMLAIDVHDQIYAAWYGGTPEARKIVIGVPQLPPTCYSGPAPVWNALYGGGNAGWDGTPSAAWVPYRH